MQGMRLYFMWRTRGDVSTRGSDAYSVTCRTAASCCERRGWPEGFVGILICDFGVGLSPRGMKVVSAGAEPYSLGCMSVSSASCLKTLRTTGTAEIRLDCFRGLRHCP